MIALLLALALAVLGEPDVVAEEIVILIDSNKVSEALRLADQAVTRYPEDVWLRFLRADALSRANRSEEALGEALLAQQGASPEQTVAILALVGSLHARLGDLASARPILERVLAADPANAGARADLAWVEEVEALQKGGPAPTQPAARRVAEVLDALRQRPSVSTLEPFLDDDLIAELARAGGRDDGAADLRRFLREQGDELSTLGLEIPSVLGSRIAEPVTEGDRTLVQVTVLWEQTVTQEDVDQVKEAVRAGREAEVFDEAATTELEGLDRADREHYVDELLGRRHILVENVTVELVARGPNWMIRDALFQGAGENYPTSLTELARRNLWSARVAAQVTDELGAKIEEELERSRPRPGWHWLEVVCLAATALALLNFLVGVRRPR